MSILSDGVNVGGSSSGGDETTEPPEVPQERSRSSADDTTNSPTPPPPSGAGASRAAWLEFFALAHPDVDTASMTRDELVADHEARTA